MRLTGCVRLGKDAELRYTAKGTAVAGLAGVYEYGMKGDDGKKPSQWVDLSLWGQQAEKMAQYLTKGTVVDVTADEVHVETYQGKNGTGAKLVGKVVTIGFAPSQPRQDSQPVSKPQPVAAQPVELDDDIPF